MSEVEISNTEKLGLACSYAALILQDGKQPINASNLQKIASSAGIQIDNFWSGVFENVLSNFDLNKLLENALGGGAGAVSTPTTTTTTTAPVEEKKEEPKEEKEEESASIGGLFGSDDD